MYPDRTHKTSNTRFQSERLEGLAKKLSVVAGSYAANFIEKRLQLDLKQFHNPNEERTERPFLEYLEVDLTQGMAAPLLRKRRSTPAAAYLGVMPQRAIKADQ